MDFSIHSSTHSLIASSLASFLNVHLCPNLSGHKTSPDWLLFLKLRMSLQLAFDDSCTPTVDVLFRHSFCLNSFTMLGLSILYLLFGINLMNMISEKQTAVYKDLRFWLVIFCLSILIVMTAFGYPAY